MLTPEMIIQFDGMVLDFLQEKDLIDTAILRMPSRKFTELRTELAVFLYKKSNPSRNQIDVGEYLGYGDAHAINKIICGRVLKRRKEQAEIQHD